MDKQSSRLPSIEKDVTFQFSREIAKPGARVKNIFAEGIGKSGTKDLLPQDGCDDSSH